MFTLYRKLNWSSLKPSVTSAEKMHKSTTFSSLHSFWNINYSLLCWVWSLVLSIWDSTYHILDHISRVIWFTDAAKTVFELRFHWSTEWRVPHLFCPKETIACCISNSNVAQSLCIQVRCTDHAEGEAMRSFTSFVLQSNNWYHRMWLFTNYMWWGWCLQFPTD